MAQYHTSDPAGVDAFLSMSEEEAYAMNFQGRLTNALGASGAYTWEIWTCQTADMWYRITPFDLGYYRACDIAKTSRWLMLPLCIFSWALLGFLAYMWWRTSRKDFVARGETKDSVALSPVHSQG
ncbi:hypothetical protein Slin15195_G072530 [Septoria linicola]|uniref:Uncharacterized protein n=1 Tax=Septoria linicola TaxID=215465 RepID=A0A9Q9ASN6_9PEZI|nr:hypothetical protein Slin14017_G105260 [Septoria linicola]USW53934.1 hypothetical protein Slin15195_G072530 [Septoria linicola]